MRISDWSSDVCSSDLVPVSRRREASKPDTNRPRMLDAWLSPTSQLCGSVSPVSSLNRSPAFSARVRGRLRTKSTAPSKLAIESRSVSARSDEHTSELQSLMRLSYAVLGLKNTNQQKPTNTYTRTSHQYRKTRNTH